MRKRCRRTIRREAAPTMVAYYLNPEVSTQERMAVVALRSGYATTSHFDVLADCRDVLADCRDVLADCRDMLTLAASEKRDEDTLAICELGLVALENIKARYLEIGRIGATGDEIQALQALVDVSEDFWKRQGGGLFIDAEAALAKTREEFRQRRAA